MNELDKVEAIKINSMMGDESNFSWIEMVEALSVDEIHTSKDQQKRKLKKL